MKKLLVFLLVLTMLMTASACGRIQGDQAYDEDEEISSEDIHDEDESDDEEVEPSPTDSEDPAPTPVLTPEATPSEEASEGSEGSEEPAIKNEPVPPLADAIISINPIQDDSHVLMGELDQDGSGIRVLEVSETGELVNTVMELRGDSWFPYAVKGQWVVVCSPDSLSLFNLTDASEIELPRSVGTNPVGFYQNRPWVVYGDYFNQEGTYEITIFDYEQKELVKTLSGYNAKLAQQDDTLYFLNYKDGENGLYNISIHSYDAEKDELLERENKEMGEYVYDITDVMPLSKDFYAYRVYDEHEYRYNTNKDYVIATKGNTYSEDVHKEQYDFSFSPDGKAGCMAERDWNSLTYIAYGDYQHEAMLRTEYYGSFPFYNDGLIYFLTDPDFVSKPDDTSFRQIEQYALYAINPKNNKLTEIYRSEGVLGIIEKY